MSWINIIIIIIIIVKVCIPHDIDAFFTLFFFSEEKKDI